MYLKSNLFKYFDSNFQEFGIDRLLPSCYREKGDGLSDEKNQENGFFFEYANSDAEKSSLDSLEVLPFDGDGDFRGAESIELLKQADIVVTNPPFSLFREYVEQLIRHDKKFLIIGNVNAITYLISPNPQPPVAGSASPAAQHGAT